MQRELFKTLKDCQLYIPVDFGIENPPDEIKSSNAFNIQFLSDEDGNKVVPLFTSTDKMEEAQFYTSAIIMHTRDIANFLTDECSVISINPYTKYDLNIPMKAFLKLFADDDLSVIVPCVNKDGSRNFVLIFNDKNEAYLPVFSSIGEFKKIFDDGDIYPEVFKLSDVLKVSDGDLVLNPASESIIINKEEIEK